MVFREHLSYSNVMVTVLAFAILCGGGAYAASQVGRGSVGTKQLKRNAVNSSKVANGSLKSKDLADGALRAGPPGVQGPAGPQGPRGTGPGFQAAGSVNFDVFSSSPFGSTVVNLAVPPGSYFATSSVEAQTVNATPSNVICRLIGGGGATTRSQRVNADMEPYNFSLAALLEVSSGETLQLQCYKSVPASGARILEANIVAVEVSEITGFPG